MSEMPLTINKQYRGITDENCLLWCHGTEGIEHQKIRKFRYPLWKYAQVSYRIIGCVCRNCSMQFYGKYAEGVPLSIPVRRIDSYHPYEIPVRVNGKQKALKGQIVRTLGQTTQEMLNDRTRMFIDYVQ
ncbi:MAG: hypothetical protein JWO07_339 [Candidatus Saccharibacteria bacterium]|nr:hypothetical protein [Candidatus Saccharibacteria bacterium]